MHIPDGFLSAPVAIACATLSAAAVGAAASRARGHLGTSSVAMMGVTAAFVFAAQMLNFPVAGGTSGHLVGGVLVAVLVGPSAAVVVMTAVMTLQCLAFGDGGLLALGANVLNMGVVHPLVGFAVYSLIAGRSRGTSPPRAARRVTAVAFASFVATVVASITCAGELTLSRVAEAEVILPAMIAVHLAIGLGEAVISALVVAALLRLRPGLVERRRLESSASASASAPAGSIVVLGLAASLALALFASPFACRWPDGLERVVERLGIEPANAHVAAFAPLRGYTVPGIAASLSTVSVVAAVGTLLAFGLSCALGSWLAPPSRP